MKPSPNVGKLDKIVRVIAGLSFVCIGVVFDNLLWIIGVLLLISSYYSFCFIYKILNIRTNKQDKNDSCCGCCR